MAMTHEMYISTVHVMVPGVVKKKKKKISTNLHVILKLILHTLLRGLIRLSIASNAFQGPEINITGYLFVLSLYL